MPLPRIPDRIELEMTSGEDAVIRYGLPSGRKAPERIYRLSDPEREATLGFVVVDDLTRGPSLGGIRLAPRITVAEVHGLAVAMTLKNAAALLPLGGGKSGLIADPRLLLPSTRTELMTRVAEALWEIPDYIPGPDMGTDEVDMQIIYEIYSEKNGGAHHGRGGVGRPPAKGGCPLDAWGITAHGLFAAAMAAEQYLPEFRIAGAQVVIQGFGNVGHAVAQKLARAGATIVGASDVTCALYHANGLDLDELCAARIHPDGLASYRGPLQDRFFGSNLDRLLKAPCDLLVPAARPDAICETNADEIQAKLILQGANNPVSPPCERYLERRKNIFNLSDFIVNAGGVIACAVERKADLEPNFDRAVRAGGENGRTFLEKLVSHVIAENVTETFDRVRASKRKMTWREAALQLAEERLGAQKHRILPELAPA